MNKLSTNEWWKAEVTRLSSMMRVGYLNEGFSKAWCLTSTESDNFDHYNFNRMTEIEIHRCLVIANRKAKEHHND